MSLIEKIDAEIVRLEKERDLFPRWINPEKHDEANAAVKEAYRIREIIISEQKEPATDNNVVTIGDKIRESNESLVEWYANRVDLYVCGESVTVNPLNKEKCLNYLNQPYTE